MQERRQLPRSPADVTARLLVGYKVVVQCMMRDLSTGGACLELADAAIVPDCFDLIADSGCHVCRVVWRRGRIIGVLFL